MKPKYLKIRNFKSIGDEVQTIELAPITLLFGPNSAGKSTVLQALIYLREVLLNNNLDPDKTELGGDWLDLGGFQNLVHGRDDKKAIEISVGFSLESENDYLSDYLTEHEREELERHGINPPETWLAEVDTVAISLEIRWSELLGKPVISSYEVWIDKSQFARIVSISDGKQVFIEDLNVLHSIFSDVPIIESLDDDPDAELFGFHFTSLINPSMYSQASASLERSLSSVDQPFAEKNLAELEDLVNEQVKGDKNILKIILEECKRRPSRHASELSKKILDYIDDVGTENKAPKYIGLLGQKDALPDSERGLLISDDTWLEDESADENAVAIKLLIKSLMNGFISGSLTCVKDWLKTVSYIGPLRDLPPRNILPQRTPDNARWAKGMAAWELLYNASPSLIEEINYWIGDGCLKTGYQIEVHRYREVPVDAPYLDYLDQEMEFDQQLVFKEIIINLPEKRRVTLREVDTDLEVMPQDIGVGISQLLPVVILTITQGSGLIAIEQPELHVHPAIQVELADLFARYALKHNKLLLLETHSEHLMLRLLRRIREQAEGESGELVNNLDKNSVSVQYVEPSPEGTRFERKRINDAGDFDDEWPNGFFDERDEELFF